MKYLNIYRWKLALNKMYMFNNCFISIKNILLICEFYVAKQYIQCTVNCSFAVLKLNHELYYFDTA
jgi:hypothetical protein